MIQLPPRQAEVLALLAFGDTDREIAFHLGIHPHTVESHIRALRVTLVARNRTHVVARAFQLGLLPQAREGA